MKRLMATGVAAWALFGAPAGVEAEPPSVLVILIDTLRADHVGAYGYERPTTPTLDRLAAAGVLFEHAESQASWTKPSIPSIFTGRYPPEHRVFTGNKEAKGDRITSDVLQASEITIAESFRDAGYRTGAFVHNAQISSFMGFDQGFGIYAEELGIAEEINAHVLEWFDGVGDGPTFAYVHYLDPHWPYTPPPPFDDEFEAPADAADELADANWKQLERTFDDRAPTEDELAALIARYDGEIRYTDHAVGQLLDALRSRGRLDDTIVLVTADHGEEFYDHGRLGHGVSLYEELVRVPLIVVGPNIAPRRVAEQVELVDVMPTLLELCGIPIPDPVSGRSVVPLLTADTGEHARAFADHRPNGSRGRIKQSVRTEHYAFIRTFASRGGDDDEDAMPEVRAGTWLEIDGAMGEDGRFLAFDVEPIPDEETHVKLSGRIDAWNEDRTLRLMGFDCRLKPDARFKNTDGTYLTEFELQSGMWVQLKGAWGDDGEFVVRRVKALPESKQEEEIKAPIETVRTWGEDGLLLTAGPITVEIDDDTDFKGEWPERTPERTPNEETLHDDAGVRALSRVELYDRIADPGETTDIAADHPDLVRALHVVLDDWEAACAAGSAGAESVELDEATIERLRSLGYIK